MCRVIWSHNRSVDVRGEWVRLLAFSSSQKPTNTGTKTILKGASVFVRFPRNLYLNGPVSGSCGSKEWNLKKELDSTIRKLYFEKPMQVTVRAKLDSYNGETRTNVSVVDLGFPPRLCGIHQSVLLESAGIRIQGTLLS